MSIFILSLLTYFVYTYHKSKRAFHMLQQNFYNQSNRYLKWCIINYKKSFITIDILGLIVVLSTFIFKNSIISVILFIIIYYLFGVNIKKRYKNEQSKKPLVITARMKRLITVILFLYIFVTTYMLMVFNINNIWIYYLILISMSIFNYLIIWLVWFISLPIEKAIYFYYQSKAKNKLENINPKVIGITGSYGKTSSKNILADILSVKYRVLPTPASFNTMLGLMTTINRDLSKFDEVFIAEMGTSRMNQIKKMCKLTNPQFGIITKIGIAHLETFKTSDNIQKAKFELAESLPEDGVIVLNKDDEKQIDYINKKIKNNCRIIWIGINNKDSDIYADNIKCTHTGTTFDVYFKSTNTKINLSTCLLGNANIYNILASLAIALEFDLTEEQIIRGVKNIKPVKNRLELKKYKDVTIIDDAYNSNPVGSKMALDVLDLMPGKKIIVTPGMIELKDKQYELNKKFGEYISSVCDEVILVGEKQTKPIYDGLIEKNYDKNKIHIINDVKIAFKLIDELKHKDTYVLLENDLPDLFNE